jgi:hypothetical protein
MALPPFKGTTSNHGDESEAKMIAASLLDLFQFDAGR